MQRKQQAKNIKTFKGVFVSIAGIQIEYINSSSRVKAQDYCKKFEESYGCELEQLTLSNLPDRALKMNESIVDQ